MVKPVDQDGNYIIDSNDRIILGNKNPKWVLGWSNTFNYKGLELGIELNGRLVIWLIRVVKANTVCTTNVK